MGLELKPFPARMAADSCGDRTATSDGGGERTGKDIPLEFFLEKWVLIRGNGF